MKILVNVWGVGAYVFFEPVNLDLTTDSFVGMNVCNCNAYDFTAV